MNKFTSHTGVVAPLCQSNVDTDQIIPKQFLKSIKRTGFGDKLFYDWRFRSDGSPDADFVLNKPRYHGASILLAGKNFGCGSSREHAPWALAEYGFRVVIAPSFADIFFSNCIQSGILPVTLPETTVGEIAQKCDAIPSYELTADLLNRSVRDDRGFEAVLEIDDFARQSLINGLDAIGTTLRHEAAIASFEADRTISLNFIGSGNAG